MKYYFLRALLFPLVLLACSYQHLQAQISAALQQEIIESGYIHKPLPLDPSKGFEAWALHKKVLKSRTLADMENLSSWSHKGIGTMSLTTERSKDGQQSLRLEAPATSPTLPSWGLGRGTSMATLAIDNENWEDYNRLHFFIYPDCEGARSIYLNLYIENGGAIKVPDRFGREGYHEINLINGQWNECFIEISGLPRDKINKLSFAIETFGQELTMGPNLRFDVDQVLLQKIEKPEVVKGWQPAEDRIIFSTTGYSIGGKKDAIVTVKNNDGTFAIKDHKTQKTVFSGKLKQEKTEIGQFTTIDFTSFNTPGDYFIHVGDLKSQPFQIGDDVWVSSTWRVLNFLFCERCGYPVPGKHGTCHTDLHANFEGNIIPINGGWHDAADMSQQTLQTGEIAYSLFSMAKKAKEKGQTDLYHRLVEEGLWGLDFVMRSRLGNGYRAASWGTNLWTDRKIGTIDDSDSRTVRVHNSALENYLLAGMEASISGMITDDEALKQNLIKIAKEDYAFAKNRFDSLSFKELVNIGGGHAAMASNSQYAANISWAASMLYQATGDNFYALEAAKAIEYTLACQRKEPLKGKSGLSGFFYRDTDKRSIVHYTHQSRDYAFMEALISLCETQPKHPAYAQWKEAIQLHGNYLKNIYKYVQPYGMLPSGVYHKDEILDSANFYVVHVAVRSGGEKDFREQYNNGLYLDEEHRLRFFPIWYSFRGNAAVHLSTGRSAALCGKFLNDPELKEIAEQQLHWIVGKNPFGQSIIYGEGSNYPQLYTALPGETVGGIPVGMQSYMNEDSPYWPQFNTATYKELWGAPAARWLQLIADL